MLDMATTDHLIQATGIIPVERQTLANAVMDRIVAYVRTSSLGPGDLLPAQHELARQLGVSRPVLREALQGLASLGLLDIRPGSGVYVRDPSTGADAGGLIEIATHAVALEVIEARMVIEVEMAGLAAQRANDEDFARMDKVLVRLKRVSARNQPTALVTSDFHRALARSCHNTMLYRMGQMLAKARVAQGERVEHALPDIAVGEYESHLRLREAVASRDAALARAEMRRHLEIAHGWEDQIARLREASITGNEGNEDLP
jgi:GntR family transcriptional regulator, transcriptional repressor for pyruvate dehydrogenase complex